MGILTAQDTLNNYYKYTFSLPATLAASLSRIPKKHGLMSQTRDTDMVNPLMFSQMTAEQDGRVVVQVT